MNRTCELLRVALDQGTDCRFALVDALRESGEFELADLYEVPRLRYDPSVYPLRRATIQLGNREFSGLFSFDLGTNPLNLPVPKAAQLPPTLLGLPVTMTDDGNVLWGNPTAQKPTGIIDAPRFSSSGKGAVSVNGTQLGKAKWKWKKARR